VQGGGVTALKAEPTPDAVRDAEALTSLGWTEPTKTVQGVAEKRAEARMKGYVGEACPECANFTLVRNGTCLKCETCGSTTGCS
jgi:ribonucleoside-diphosphate reductase alpha chain